MASDEAMRAAKIAYDACEGIWTDDEDTIANNEQTIAEALDAFAAQAIAKARDAQVCEGLKQAQRISRYLRTRTNPNPVVTATLDDFDVFLAAHIARGGYDSTTPIGDWSRGAEERAK